MAELVDKFAGSEFEQRSETKLAPKGCNPWMGGIGRAEAPWLCRLSAIAGKKFRFGEMAELVEGAPLLRAYGSKAHRGFESLSLRQTIK